MQLTSLFAQSVLPISLPARRQPSGNTPTPKMEGWKVEGSTLLYEENDCRSKEKGHLRVCRNRQWIVQCPDRKLGPDAVTADVDSADDRN
ncbi:hypothetical protein D8W71_19030 [Rhodococcus sp. P1Y]|nr:hypothetical protein D8W71_19030 [Rhodococcus sp. P1Y]